MGQLSRDNSVISFLAVRRRETGDRRQETGDRRLFLFILPIPPHPTPPTPPPPPP
ncbi:MAG: hypothetical protein GPJ13_14445, partial [Microcystis aeruginosa W11-06]|nr:hypothetical protein [Microcystis aeruginosa W11-06]